MSVSVSALAKKDSDGLFGNSLQILVPNANKKRVPLVVISYLKHKPRPVLQKPVVGLF